MSNTYSSLMNLVSVFDVRLKSKDSRLARRIWIAGILAGKFSKVKYGRQENGGIRF